MQFIGKNPNLKKVFLSRYNKAKSFKKSVLLEFLDASANFFFNFFIFFFNLFS